MHAFHFFSPVNVSNVWSEYFFLSFPARPALGWLVGGGLLSSFYTCLWCSWFLPCALIFTRCLVRNLGYPISLDYQPYPIWKPLGSVRFSELTSLGSPLRSWGVSLWLFLIWHFWKEPWSDPSKLRVLLRDLVLSIRTNFLDILPLVSGLPRPFFRYWVVAFLWNNLGPLVPLW